METFIRQKNVERFCHLLRTITDEHKKRTVERLLAEERQGQRDAGEVALDGWRAPRRPLPRTAGLRAVGRVWRW
jgi:hypothetical protein